MIDCKHLELKRLADTSPENALHDGSGTAYYCHACGSVFFLTLVPAEISVSYDKPSDPNPSREP